MTASNPTLTHTRLLMRHFLKETDFNLSEIENIFQLAKSLKAERGKPNQPKPLAGQTWGLLFSKSSTRTRVSFEVGILELGGQPIYLDQRTMQLGRGETVSDTAKVLSRYLHGVVIRCHEHGLVDDFAKFGSMPVVNGLTDFLHPCQLYTDLFTLAEKWAKPGQAYLEALKGKTVAFFGDCSSNMAHSWIISAAITGIQLKLAGPQGFAPSSEVDALLAAHGLPKNYSFTTNAIEAATGADCLYTDVFVSMGKEEETALRLAEMLPYQVNSPLMAAAKPNALFLHCLPAHYGEEVTEEVFNSPNSVVFDEAENRLHVQKAILCQLV